MDYERIYNDLILHRQKNPIISGYIERHHIIPTSLGGSDDDFNKVALTGREHYIAHLLLARFNRCSQTAYALWMMQCKSELNEDRPCINSSRMYEWARKEFAKYISRNNSVTSKGERNGHYGTHWIKNLELKESIRLDKMLPIPEGWIKGRIQKGIPCSIEQRIKKSKAQKDHCFICNILLKKQNWQHISDVIPEGWVIGTLISKQKELLYMNSSNKTMCRCCNKLLSYEKRKNMFCNKSCKVKYQHIHNPEHFKY